MAGLRLWWTRWRNSRLSDPSFQRFSADFALTRGVAHAHTARLFDLVAGFAYAQILYACVDLGVLGVLGDGPQDATALAAKIDIPAPSAARLLAAAAALGLAERIGDDVFTLGPDGAALIGNPGLSDMIAHHRHFYADMADPAALLRRGKGDALAGFWPYATAEAPAGSAASSVAAYTRLMGATQPAVAADILDAYPMRRHRVLMDVGGGEGVFLSAAGRRWTHLGLRLFDLPAVAALARTRLEALPGRAQTFGGDFLADTLPKGSDLITLIRILHDHDDRGVEALLARAYAALEAGGRLLIAEPLADSRRPNRSSDAYFGFYLLAMGRGRARTFEELRAFLRAAGFSKVRQIRTRTPMLLRIVLGER